MAMETIIGMKTHKTNGRRVTSVKAKPEFLDGPKVSRFEKRTLRPAGEMTKLMDEDSEQESYVRNPY